MPKVSGRKQNEQRQREKRLLDAYKSQMDYLTEKMNQKIPLRDEELRFLKTVMKELPALEENLAEKENVEGLPEGRLKEFIERLLQLQDIGSLDEIIEATGYYRCLTCNELHAKNRICMFEEFKNDHPKIGQKKT